MLTIEAVTWGPEPGLDVVRDVSLTVPEGMVVGLVGPNGAGKSSLLRCVYRVNRPRSGSIRLGHEDLWALQPREAARRIAAVVQNAPYEDELLVHEIVALGRLPHRGRFDRPNARDEDAIESAIVAAELTTLASRRMATLSGGERQRVAIARVLAQEPEAIILDEPTNHLDIRHQLELVALLRRLGRTTLITLHDLPLAARCCDRVAVLREGRLVADGLPAEVMTPRILADSFGVHADVRLHASGSLDLSFQLPRHH
jgi:iron complex transport system ATP-binding protein